MPFEEKRLGWGPHFSHLPKAVPERGESVLCVHEDESCRRWLGDVMRKEGYDVDETASIASGVCPITSWRSSITEMPPYIGWISGCASVYVPS